MRCMMGIVTLTASSNSTLTNEAVHVEARLDKYKLWLDSLGVKCKPTL